MPSPTFSIEDRRTNVIPMTCQCGSTHFFKVAAEEFSNQGYGSAEFRSLTAYSQEATTYICLCGLPAPMKEMSHGGVRPANNARGRFLRSLTHAIASVTGSKSQASSKGLVSIAEFEELKELVDIQGERIEWLMDSVEMMASGDRDRTGEDT